MKKIVCIVFFIILFLAVISIGCYFCFFHIAAEWLWFKSVGYESIYYKEFFIKTIYFFVPFLFFFILFFLWFNIIRRFKISVVLNLIFFVLSIGYGFWGLSNWDLLVYMPVKIVSGFKDAYFNIDAFFYICGLPVARLSVLMLFSFFIISLVLNLVLHKEGEKAGVRNGRIYFNFSSAILFILSAATGLIYFFTIVMEMLVKQPNSQLGVDYIVFFGNIYGCFVWMLLALIFSAVLIMKSRKGLGVFTVLLFPGVLVLLYFGLTLLYPYILDNLYVKPNELMVQRTFVRNRIEATRNAFGLKYSPLYYPEYDDVKNRFSGVLNALRIWDSDPYKRVVNQVQSIKTYFTFYDVDTDIYPENQVFQVVLSARELNMTAIPAESLNWDNKHLRYTHGYGAVVSPSYLADGGGNPVFWLGNLDQKPVYSNLTVDENQIYFGELTSNYIIINTKADEFEFTSSTNRITTRYKLKRGVALDSFMKKLVYSVEMKEKNILLSGYLTKNSSIIYHREILERVRKIFPFLQYDNDPYITIINGKLYWIIDAYTVSGRFPVSEKYRTVFGMINYIRNSVKVVVNAYSGDTDFYLTGSDDPVAAAYGILFPGLFKKEIPVEIKEHFRYPYELLKIQSDVMCKYHVENEDSFYSSDDIWEIPKQIYGDKPVTFEPYYITAIFETNNTGQVTNCHQHFSVIEPFSPRGKENLAGWALAYFDEGHKLTLHFAESSSSCLGPMQVESKINQDDKLSGLFTLWSQKGSKIFRGNIKFIPVNGKNSQEDNILYIVPIFLESEGMSIPQLVRVVAIYDNTVYSGNNYNDLLYNMMINPAVQNFPNKK